MTLVNSHYFKMVSFSDCISKRFLITVKYKVIRNRASCPVEAILFGSLLVKCLLIIMKCFSAVLFAEINDIL